MAQTQTNSLPASDKRFLFVTSRPSRASQVTCADADYEARLGCEIAWAKEIGMDISKAESFGNLITGSPSGTKTIHSADDLYDDIGPIG